MVKMMMTVVIVFTICWLPFNVLILIMDNDERLGNWSGLPFVWTALHWLSMSHSCYNPVIYCWMNARFRAGFIAAFARVPGIRRMIRTEQQNNYNTSMAGIPMTGFNGSSHTVLRRMNSCTTYVSVRRKTNGSHTAPARSASFRNNESPRSTIQQPPRHFMRLESHSEEQI
ncbi:hypothetical protein KM043_006926 [Ampulex compressa]|nr:hypothetical protein KM043_006926 [Ampulex compressa]